MLLETRPGWRVVGEAASQKEAVAIATREQPDVILLDLVVGNDSAIELLPKLLSAAPRTRILMLTGIHDPALHQQAIRSGAMGLVLKEHAADVLIKAVEKVATGEVWLDRSTITTVIREMAHVDEHNGTLHHLRVIESLTQREREVIALLGEGLKNKQVAERLHVSEATVRHYLTSIFNKLGVHDRLGLIMYAYRYGLAKPPR
jgi:DNA-binding NarL/FixJ family response regulator